MSTIISISVSVLRLLAKNHIQWLVSPLQCQIKTSEHQSKELSLMRKWAMVMIIIII